MLLAILASVLTVGGFSYKTEIADRRKPIVQARSGNTDVWEERLETIVATEASDQDFSRLMRKEAIQFRDAYYRGQLADHSLSFDTYNEAGRVDVTETVIAASPDLVSAEVRAIFYITGTPHPNVDGKRNLIWSRRLRRLLAQQDVFAVPPDRALRRLALARFDNRDGLQRPDDPDGLPLSWNDASIGLDGITWSFSPYMLGGYTAGGTTTVPWLALKPYLRTNLPFVIGAIRASPE